MEIDDHDHPSSFADATSSGKERDVVILQESNHDNKSLETIVAFLMNLAKLPPQQLWDMFGMEGNTNNGKDPFSLQELQQGKCPTGLKTAEWLPPRPWNSEELSSLFKSNVEKLKSGGNTKNEERVIVWYEHLSKAGGTTFCGLARTHFGKAFVPKYFCMPKKFNTTRLDGRVGSWTNEELIEYAQRERHLLVSNEWDFFNIQKLQLSGRSLDGKELHLSHQLAAPQLLFVTTLRDPLDRLLSSYLFFGAGESPSDFAVWTKRNFNRLGGYRLGQFGTYRCNIARYNAITWRYSGGLLKHDTSKSSTQESQFPPPMIDEQQWRTPFQTAIRVLSQQDLVLPLDIMSKEEGAKALRSLLGWKSVEIKGKGGGNGDKKNGHIVTSGEIRNSNARDYLSEQDYRFLWDANWLDNILVRWCRAVFLARLHCQDV